jgi:hypothetical protein
MAWAQLIGAALGAYGSYAAAQQNEEAQEAAMAAGTGAVNPWGVYSGVGYARPDIEGKGWDLGLTAPWQAEADYFLGDAAANKGWLSQYQEGGPAVAANTLFEQRAEPLRRQQEREKQLFEEQALARGMLQAAPTDRLQGEIAQGWGNVYSDVYNKSFMDVQSIIDRYRDRISGSVTAAGSIYDKPLEYATSLGMPQGEVYSPTGVTGLEALSGAGTTGSAAYGNFFTNLGTDIQAGKYPIGSGSTSAGTHKPFRPPAGGMVAGPMFSQGGYKSSLYG